MFDSLSICIMENAQKCGQLGYEITYLHGQELSCDIMNLSRYFTYPASNS